MTPNTFESEQDIVAMWLFLLSFVCGLIWLLKQCCCSCRSRPRTGPLPAQETFANPTHHMMVVLNANQFAAFAEQLQQADEKKSAFLKYADDALQDTAVELIKRLHVTAAYVHSDRIYLFWKRVAHRGTDDHAPHEVHILGGNIQRIVSTVSSAASMAFRRHLYDEYKVSGGDPLTFRAELSTFAESISLANHVMREQERLYDCGIRRLAALYFQPSDICGQDRKGLLSMLMGRGLNLTSIPTAFFHGTTIHVSGERVIKQNMAFKTKQAVARYLFHRRETPKSQP